MGRYSRLKPLSLTPTRPVRVLAMRHRAARRTIGRMIQRRMLARRGRGTYTFNPYTRRAKYTPKKQQVGEPLGTSTAKKHAVDFPQASRNGRTLYLSELTDIARTSTNEIFKRQRDVINLRGFRLQGEIQNNGTKPIYVNMAVICCKSAQTVSVTDFFRSPAGTDERATDFSTNLSSIDFRTLAINDDEYIVLLHKRFRLEGTGGTGAVSKTGFTYKTFKRWLSLNRQLRYGSTGASTCETPVFFVHWADQFLTPGVTGAQTNIYDIAFKMQTYFREPKS